MKGKNVKRELGHFISWGGSDRSFEEVFLQAVDEGLSFLGESGKQAVYFHLERLFASRSLK